MATTNGLEILLRALRTSLGFVGKTDTLATGTDHITDTLKFKMVTQDLNDLTGAYVQLATVFTGTATSTTPTTLVNTANPFPGTNALTGAVVSAFTDAGALTQLVIVTDSNSTLTGAAWTNGTPSQTTTYTVTYGYVGKVTRIDPSTGKVYIDPPVADAIQANTQYQLLMHGITPDEFAEARDIVLENRTSPWRTKPLSIFKEVADWRTGAYSAVTGGVTNAAAAPQALDFPNELFANSMLVTNSGAAGIISSEVYDVQPAQVIHVVGSVSVRAQTASIRVRDITNGVDITVLGGVSTFTFRGRQWFNVTATVPAACSQIQVWLGGASASCISEWAGVCAWVDGQTVFVTEPRVISRHDIGELWAYNFPITGQAQTLALSRFPIPGVVRDTAGDAVVLYLDQPCAFPIYYKERHRYTALQSDYVSLLDRVTGLTQPTDVNPEYAAWSTLVELLEVRGDLTDTLKQLYTVADKNMRAWDRRVGADPEIHPEYATQTRIPVKLL